MMYKLIVDVSELDYIASAGVGALIGAIGVVQENQGNVIIVNPKPEIKRVLDLFGLPQICTIVDNMEAALTNLGWESGDRATASRRDKCDPDGGYPPSVGTG